jgi:Raf kinase inhibitor-like YbhB/YbcL family protein
VRCVALAKRNDGMRRAGWRTWLAAALGTAVLALSGCGGGDEETVRPEQLAAEGVELIVFELSSTAFDDSTEIPVRYTCDGEDLSPPLAWADAPAGTAALALLVDDPDAPGGTFTHWLAWGLDASAGEHAEGSRAPVEGKNGFGSTGYRGPCPPRGDGPHRYVFRLFALDSELELSDGADKKAFQEALQGRVLGTAELVGSYARR